jgi:hypothetical protein
VAAALEPATRGASRVGEREAAQQEAGVWGTRSKLAAGRQAGRHGRGQSGGSEGSQDGAMAVRDASWGHSKRCCACSAQMRLRRQAGD